MNDALSRFPTTGAHPSNADDSFPEYLSSDKHLTYAGSRGPILDEVICAHLSPAGVDGQRDEWSLSALLIDTADRSMQTFLTDHSNFRVIEDWEAEFFSFPSCAALGSEPPLRIWSRARIHSSFVRDPLARMSWLESLLSTHMCALPIHSYPLTPLDRPQEYETSAQRSLPKQMFGTKMR